VKSNVSLFAIFILLIIIFSAGCAQEAPEAAPPAVPPVTDNVGKTMFTSKGCTACHGAGGEGIPNLAPALKGLLGSKVELTSGETVTADEAFIKESIKNPGAKIVAGYAELPMLEIPLTDEELEALVGYVKEL